MAPEFVIDGSQGEGGGQILRTALALSLVTGRPIRIESIRAGRERPGLMRQHLTAVRAAVEVGQATVAGDTIGSQVLTFVPSAIQGGEYAFSVGTAGSATLVLQTVLPALLISGAPTNIVLEGGTHNPWAPPFDFLKQSLFPLVNRMGPRVETELHRHGFYPAGGGRFTVSIVPVDTLRGFDLLVRGAILERSATAIVANLPSSIGAREIEVAAEKLGWGPAQFHLDDTIDSHGPGNVFLVDIQFEQVREIFTGFGRAGTTAEHVAMEVVKEVRAYLASNVPVGIHLADQWILLLGIAAWQTGQGGSFRTLPLTRHSQTQISLLRSFLEIPIEVETTGRECRVTCGCH